MKRSYTITKDSDMLAPQWLALRINYRTIRFVYRVSDGASHLKGVMIGDEIAEIGDAVCFDGKRLSVERR